MDVAATTVGRHVETLADNGLLGRHIIAPDEAAPDLIATFKLSDQGREVLNENDGGVE